VNAEEAARRVAAVVPDDPLSAFLARPWPWRVVVLGRIGVGKTTWVNALALRDDPTGLGGCTKAPAVREARGVELIDTPGIDEVEDAVDVLAPLVEDADAVVWIVDGLQPVTSSERAVVARVVPDGMAVHTLISRFDLVPEDEREAVVSRVSKHTRGPVLGVDLRHGIAPDAPLAPSGSSPRRRAAFSAAVAAARAALDALPALPTADQVLAGLRARWRETVREVESVIEDEILRGVIDHKEVALRLFARGFVPARLQFVGSLEAPLPPGQPDLPTFTATQTGKVEEALAAFAGQEGARRALRATAGRLVLEGEVALADWVALGLPTAEESDRRAVAREALDALGEAGCTT
jgi:hypothetical protein